MSNFYYKKGNSDEALSQLPLRKSRSSDGQFNYQNSALAAAAHGLDTSRSVDTLVDLRNPNDSGKAVAGGAGTPAGNSGGNLNSGESGSISPREMASEAKDSNKSSTLQQPLKSSLRKNKSK